MRSSLLASTIVVALLAPAAAEACSKVRFSARRLPGNEAVIAIATTQTIRVRGAAELPAASGMIARIERVGTLSSLAQRTPSEVVFVPWDYGADCKTEPWTRNTAWTPAGKRGLYIGTLRDSNQWVGGRPTIDIHFPSGFPYTDEKPTADEILTAYDLLPVLPNTELDSGRTHSAYLPLLRWSRTHPALAQTRPILEMVAQAKHAIARSRVQSITSPIAGTYRMTAGLTGGDSSTFFAVSELHPITSLEGADRLAQPSYDAEGILVPVGYYLYTLIGSSAAEARRLNARSDYSDRHEGYLAAMIHPSFASADSTVWRGSADVLPGAGALFAGLTPRPYLGKATREYTEYPASYVPGRFVMHREGRVTFDVAYSLPGRPTLFLHGTRVSPEVQVPRR